MKKKLKYSNIIILFLTLIMAFVTINAVNGFSTDNSEVSSSTPNNTEIIDENEIDESEITPGNTSSIVYTESDCLKAWDYAYSVLQDGMGYKLTTAQSILIHLFGGKEQVFSTTRSKYSDNTIYNYAESHGSKDNYEEYFYNPNTQKIYLRESTVSNKFSSTQVMSESQFTSRKGNTPNKSVLILNSSTLQGSTFSKKYLRTTNTNGTTKLERLYSFRTILNSGAAAEYKVAVKDGAKDYTDGKDPRFTSIWMDFTVNEKGYFTEIKYGGTYVVHGYGVDVNIDFQSTETYDQNFMNIYNMPSAPSWAV